MPSDSSKEHSRRTYWSRFMDEAYRFVEEIIAQPVAESGELMTPLPVAVKQAGVEVTFSEKPHVDGHERLYYLREGLIEDFM